MRVIIAGGGTGGHIFPAVAIGHALQRLQPGTQLLFVGAKGKMEMEKVPQEGFEIIGLDIAGFNRSNLLKNILLPFKLIKSAMQAGNILKQFKPDAVVGVGGYASFPVLNAAQRMGIPTLIQEQNSFAGKSNKILGKKAKAICVAYEHMDRFFPKDKVVLTGNPVRKNISQSTISREEGQLWLNMNKERLTILVVGGSLGAKSINEAIDQYLDEIIAEDVQLIWQTGKPYFEQAKARAAAFSGKVKVFDFIREMDYGYAAADIVISRAGALAIAELCIAGKPVVFVPYPFAAEDHQTSNAMALVEHNAALLVKDHDANVELVKKVKSLLHDTAMQEIMTKNLKALAIKDADERIAKKVIEIVENR
ncbi:MAG: undecaprenyldiphospho-muramoylpentapeptide beta-N-acetylglucosaminyltransferase [Bacteroidota bacterium]